MKKRKPPSNIRKSRTKKRPLSHGRDECVFLNLEELREHEEIRPDYLEALKNEILCDGILKMPIAVDKNTFIILDGHHRLHALRKMGSKKIPVILVDYQSQEVQVVTWREGENITKEIIIHTALTGRRMPPKT